jgi:transcriptional regulator with XRE-family HTH domain
MNDIKNAVAKNISELRQARGMTQIELAERLNYSDKAISKWERAESIPDVTVLVTIAELFGVTLDYLVTEEHEAKAPAVEEDAPGFNRRAVAYVSECGAWIVAVLAFIFTTLIIGEMTFQFLYFVYAVPVALIIKLVFNSIWFNRRNNYFIISLLMWSVLASIHITFLYFKVDVSLIYLAGVAGQMVVVLSSFITKPKAK